ncbi:MAG: helix-turn-helix domain-containing protein [Vicinamibacterales bacterium]
MSPRPKTASDDVILDAAARQLDRLGPARMRLEDVAREVGLAPATLLLRFKSKRGLLLAVAERGIAEMADYFRARRARAASPLDAITDACDCIGAMAEAPQQLANLLAFHQLSLEDPEFRAVAKRHDAALAAEMARLLEEARAAGQLADCDTGALARAVIAMTRGSLLTWTALGRHDNHAAWVKADLEILLHPFRRAGLPRQAGQRRDASAAGAAPAPAPTRLAARRSRAARS